MTTNEDSNYNEPGGGGISSTPSPSVSDIGNPGGNSGPSQCDTTSDIVTLDCDTDVTKWNRLHELRTPPRSSQRRQIDLQQLQAGQKVVKKYRKYARNAEFRRLRTIVPTLASKNDVSKSEILEETIQYIDSLHNQLLATIKTKGLPTSLKQSLEAHKADLDLKDEEAVIQSVQNFLRPDIERRLTAKKRLDDLAESTLLENIDILEKSLHSKMPQSDPQEKEEVEKQQDQQPVPSTSKSASNSDLKNNNN